MIKGIELEMGTECVISSSDIQSNNSGWYIYGAGDFGRHAVYELIHSGKKVLGIFDNRREGICCGLPIKKIDDTAIKMDSHIVIAMAQGIGVVDVYNALKEHGFQNIYLYQKSDVMVPFKLIRLEWGKCAVYHVEMHIADNCNLNCKGCCHYAPIFDETGADFESRIEDVKNLKRLFSTILQFFILGGEPFLNPGIGDYAKAIRNILRTSRLAIVTNGLLIPSIEKSVLETIAESGWEIWISEYEPTYRHISEITKRLDQYSIPYVIHGLSDKSHFNLPLTLNNQSELEHLCISPVCVNIRDGKISRCPQLMFIPDFNRYFGCHLPEQGILNLDDFSSGTELYHELRKSVSLCAHCVKNEIDWDVCGKHPDISDFACNE